MKKIILTALCGLAVSFAFAQFPVTDGFDTTGDAGWSVASFTAGSADTGFTRGYDPSVLTNPVPETAPGGDGKVLKVEINATAAVEQTGLITLGEATWSDYEVTWSQYNYVNTENTNGTTQFNGVGVRMDDTGDNGYKFEGRTDESGLYGSYLNFIKVVAGEETTVNRIFFQRGTSTAWENSPVVGDGSAGSMNTWHTYKVAIANSTLALYIDDMETPLMTYADNDSPIAAGKVGIIGKDIWESAAGADNVLTFFENLEVGEYVVPTQATQWNLFK